MREHFLTQGVLLDEFLHVLSELKVLCEKCFINLYYVSQKHFEWCKGGHNETIYFLYLYYCKFFSFFWKKDYKFRKPFFLIEGKKMNFDFEGMKSFSEDTLNLKDIST